MNPMVHFALDELPQSGTANGVIGLCDQRYGDQSPALAAMPLLKAVEQNVSGTVQISPAEDGAWFTELSCP